MIVFEHLQDRRPELFKIFFGKPRLLREHGGNISLGTIQPVGDKILLSHFRLFLRFIALSLFFHLITLLRHGLTGDGDLLRQNGIDAPCKVDLNGAAHDATWIVTCTHDCAKRTDVKIILADILPCDTDAVCIFPLFFCLEPAGFIGFGKLGVERPVRLDEDIAARLPLVRDFDKVADLALEADIGNDADACFGVHAGHIARIRIAVGVSVLTIKKHYKFIAVCKRCHCFSSPFSFFSYNFCFC